MAQRVAGLSYCAGQVRNNQRDRYLATLLAPAAAREALFGLYAFDHEIGKVRHVVSQPIAGLIRLQWWRDALGAIAAGRPPAQPVALALGAALRGAPACRPHLDRALEARARALDAPPPASLAALDQELDGTSGAITQAALAVLGATDAAAHEVGRKVGLVVGCADLLRDLDLDLRAGRVRLPTAELIRHGLDPERVASAGPSLAPVIQGLAGRGLELLEAARAERPAVPQAALAALLPGGLAGDYLARVRRAGSTVGPPARSPLAPLRLLARHARGRF